MLWDSTNLDVSAAMKRGQPKAGKKAYGKTPTPWQMDAVTKAADLDGDRRGDRLGDRHGDHNVDGHGDGHAHRPTPPRPFTEPTGFEICTCWRLSFPTAKLNKEHDAWPLLQLYW